MKKKYKNLFKASFISLKLLTATFSSISLALTTGPRHANANQGDQLLVGRNDHYISRGNEGDHTFGAAGHSQATPAAQIDEPTAQQEQGKPYIVQRGDTLGSIAARQNTDVGEIIAANNLTENFTRVYVGQTLNMASLLTFQGNSNTVHRGSVRLNANQNATYSGGGLGGSGDSLNAINPSAGENDGDFEISPYNG